MISQEVTNRFLSHNLSASLKTYPVPHFQWPRISSSAEKAVIKQLHSAISIATKSDIVRDFEDRFADLHNIPYALSYCNATSALASLFKALGFGPADEVIAPTYTFFATASPLFQTGARPVLADCTELGTIDPRDVERKITPQTKAIIVSHVWGHPCEMDTISTLCSRNGLILIEDCSHAHGATYRGQLVGTFGDAAVWSFQGKKNLTGGEAGILLTKHKDIYERSLIFGHSKRAAKELGKDHPLYHYRLTGDGSKSRPHPLGLALAHEQLKYLDEWNGRRRAHALLISEGLKDIPFLSLPIQAEAEPAWYAYVMRFCPEAAPCPTADEFVYHLHNAGLIAFDRPSSTRPLHSLPLFRNPGNLLPHLYPDCSLLYGELPHAETFFRNAIKLPVSPFADERRLLEIYIEGLRAVSEILVRG